MKKNYINPTFKVYCFEPEGRVIMASPGAGQIIDNGDETVTKPGGEQSGGTFDAGGYRNNLWN